LGALKKSVSAVCLATGFGLRAWKKSGSAVGIATGYGLRAWKKSGSAVGIATGYGLRAWEKSGSSVGIATGYGLDDRVHLMTFYFSILLRPSSGANPASYSMGIGYSFPRVKRTEREADLLSRTITEVKRTGI
jgi:hypothetical protein